MPRIRWTMDLSAGHLAFGSAAVAKGDEKDVSAEEAAAAIETGLAVAVGEPAARKEKK